MAEKNKSNFWGNLGDVYASLGGISAIFSSSYFILSIVLSLMGWRSIFVDNDINSWTTTIIAIFPSLAGFSIAAFALLFALLDQRTKELLGKPSERFGGNSPLMIVVSILTHALIVQVVAILYALSFQMKPFPDFLGISLWANKAFAYLGIWITFYGVLLMIAVVLTIFKMVELLNKPHPPHTD
ncbi:hypothetical protein [Hyphomonas oceanitis]|uniref:hypothetical protein n=1 Tax=Hyphomonas oceanitis TaxID=81033 RepID=UPI0030038114